METSFPKTEKYRFKNHGKINPHCMLHTNQNCPFTRKEKSIWWILLSLGHY